LDRLRRSPSLREGVRLRAEPGHLARAGDGSALPRIGSDPRRWIEHVARAGLAGGGSTLHLTAVVTRRAGARHAPTARKLGHPLNCRARLRSLLSASPRSPERYLGQRQPFAGSPSASRATATVRAIGVLRVLRREPNRASCSTRCGRECASVSASRGTRPPTRTGHPARLKRPPHGFRCRGRSA